MPKNVIIWTAASQTWRAVRATEPHRFRFEPLHPAFIDDLRRRAEADAQRNAPQVVMPPLLPPGWPMTRWEDD
jgi:hypothetical protein